MKHFAIEYHRPTGELKIQEFSDPELALAARFDAESRLSTDWEVITLMASSLEAIKKTHSRYFFTAGEILQQAADSLAEINSAV